MPQLGAKMLIKIPRVGMQLMIKYPTYSTPPPLGVNIRAGNNNFLPGSTTWRQTFPADQRCIFMLNLQVHKHIVFWLTMVLNSWNNVCQPYDVAPIVEHGCKVFLQIFDSKSSFTANFLQLFNISCKQCSRARLFFPPLVNIDRCISAID